TVVVRLLERDERLFAFLLAVVMVGGLATLGLALRPRHRIDLPSLVFWFAMYKVGILALVSVNPRWTRAVFSGALAVHLLLIFSCSRPSSTSGAAATASSSISSSPSWPSTRTISDAGSVCSSRSSRGSCTGRPRSSPRPPPRGRRWPSSWAWSACPPSQWGT